MVVKVKDGIGLQMKSLKKKKQIPLTITRIPLQQMLQQNLMWNVKK